MKTMFVTDSSIPNVERDLENQKSELIALKQYSANMDFKYNKIVISSDDKIIPSKNYLGRSY